MWEERLDYIIKQLDAGIPMKTIGAEFGVTRQRIYQVMTRFNLPTQTGRKSKALRFTNSNDYVIYKLLCSKGILPKTYKYVLLHELIPAPLICPVLNVPLDYSTKSYKTNRSDFSPSIDRIDNTKGYISGNCLVVSWRASRLKNDGNPLEHLQIYNYYSALDK